MHHRLAEKFLDQQTFGLLTGRKRRGFGQEGQMKRLVGFAISDNPVIYKRQRLGASTVPADRLRAERPDHVWALDFQFDQTADGRVLKLLSRQSEDCQCARSC